jgi:uncharacterized protein
MVPIESRIAAELSVKPQQVLAAVALLDGGATVPFIARYRKEATGGLDDAQLRTLQERLAYLRELEERRAVVLKRIAEQGKLDPQTEAAKYLKAPFTTERGENPGVPDPKAALEGAREVLMEQFAEAAALVGELREHLRASARVLARVAEGKEGTGAKFRDYFDYQEPLEAIPSHRALALFRGRKEEVLQLALKLPEELEGAAQSAAPAEALNFLRAEDRLAFRHFQPGSPE